MIKEAMAYLLDISRPDIVVSEQGIEYSNRGLKPIPIPQAKLLAGVGTLDALFAFIDSPEVDSLQSKMEIVVEDYSHVWLCTPPQDRLNCQRETLLEVVLPSKSFPFGRYIAMEDFIIQVQCMFVDSNTKSDLLKFVSSVTEQKIVSNSDDGVSQRVEIRDSVTGRSSLSEVTPVMELSPYRTFPDVVQPLSRFLLRIKSDEGRMSAALYEADGGLWKAQAAQNLATYIRNNTKVANAGIYVIG